MKKLLLSACSLALCSYAFINDTFQQLGTTIEEAKQITLEQLARDEFSVYAFTYNMQQSCRQLPVGAREAAVASAAKAMKDYVQSPGFKTDYQNYLAKTYPVEEFNANDPKWAEMQKNKLDDLTKMLNTQVPGFDAAQTFKEQLDVEIESFGGFLQMPDDQLKMMNAKRADIQKDMDDDKMLNALYASNKEGFKKKYAEIMSVRGRRLEMATEKANIENTNNDNKQKIAAASNYKAQLRKQLQAFLDESAGIDFNAQLKQEGRTKVFANPEYESKPSSWKFYYRAGAGYVNTARKFAEAWLAELH